MNTNSIDVPPALAANIRGVHGARGDEWLARLPKMLAECQRRWAIHAGAPLPGLSFNYVLAAEAVGGPKTIYPNGQKLILKLGVPHPELTCEIEALRLYQAQGAVRLLAADPELGALLLERVAPGHDLTTLEDDEATVVAAGIMRQLWRPLPAGHPFPTVAVWARGLQRLRARFEGGTGPLPEALVARAEALYADLLASAAPPVLLHGDLHHYNILAARRQPWLAIDPKGLAGEPAYEPCALLLNPVPHLLAWAEPGRVLARRLDLLAVELGLDRRRLAAWATAHAVLSACWSLEDKDPGWPYAITCAGLLARLI